MNILTLNCTITQLRCRFLPSGIQYECMINNHWQPVTHKFVEILWSLLIKQHKQQRALVKNNLLSYIYIALAKSSVKLGGLQFSHAHNRALCGFFVHNSQIHLFNGGLGEGVERLAGFVCASPPTLLSSPPICLAALVVSFINNHTRAVSMTTIPNEIVSNKSISISQIDKINKNLIQAEAILHLLSINSRAEIQISDNLVCEVLWAVSDLVADARHCLHHTPNVEVPA